jgi:hypothetical protein
MLCPRCSATLRERGPNRRWMRFFECHECYLTFELVTERHREPCGHDPSARFLRHTTSLQPGRTRATSSL